MKTLDPASLDNLHDFVVPDPVGWLPLAPAGKVLVLLAAVWLTAWLWMSLVRYVDNAYRRRALSELSAIESWRDTARLTEVVRVNEILKRTAMVTYGRDVVASLHGQHWLGFLGAQQHPASVLADASSRVQPIELSRQETVELYAFARRWIRHHRSEGASC